MNLRDRARGQTCYARIPGICCGNVETVVLAHIRKGGTGGMGIKPADVCALPACATCHDAADGRYPIRWEEIEHNIFIGLLQWLDHCYRQGWIKETRNVR